MNIWERLKRESGKSTYDISKEINVPEETVKEIISGDREVPTERVDEVYNAFKNKNANKISSVERALMEKFFMDNDIQDLKKKFGYKTLEELSEVMHIGVSTMYYLRGPKIKAMSDNLLKKAYDFFQDGFNKKVNRGSKRIYNLPNVMHKEDLSQEVLDWYENVDLVKLREKQKITAKQLLKRIGFKTSYLTVYYKAEHKKIDDYKEKYGNWIIVQQLYNYYNGYDLIQIYEDIKPEKIKVEKNEKPIFENTIDDNINRTTDDINYDDTEINEEIEEETQMLDNDSPANDEETTDEEIKTDEEIEVDDDLEKITVSIEFVDDLISRVRRYEYLIDLLMEKDNR